MSEEESDKPKEPVTVKTSLKRIIWNTSIFYPIRALMHSYNESETFMETVVTADQQITAGIYAGAVATYYVIKHKYMKMKLKEWEEEEDKKLEARFDE